MKYWYSVASVCLAVSMAANCAAEEPRPAAGMPMSVAALWADFDPRKDPLEVEVIREWQEDGGTFRHVRYLIGTFKGQPARMAAIYGFPADAAKDPKPSEKLPAVMHIHGGGQRGSLSEVKLLVARGYAALSVNWGGDGDGQPPFNSVEGAQDGDPNTDWGAVDPSQLNVQGYASMLPGPKQFFDDREHPKNNNWYLLTVGCRRGLTFLEQQPEVDPQRLGVHGYSMGGNLTMYVAGTDDRVKAAVPGVGGQGWRWEAHEFTGGKARRQVAVRGDVDVFRRTLSFESYAPLIRCPVLHRSATNDFHGWMDDVYRTNALIPDQATRYAWTPHMNHRLSPAVAVAMPLWFDHFLKGGPALPETPASRLVIYTAAGVPVFQVLHDDSRGSLREPTPDRKAANDWPAARCEIFYSVDSDPRARFWRSGHVVREAGGFTAWLPIDSVDRPLFVFANVYFTLPQPVSLAQLPGHSQPIRELCLSTQLHSVTAAALRKAQTPTTAEPTALIDDFSNGLRDWYELNAGNHAHRQLWTRKITDPQWRGPDGASLQLTLKMPRTNRLSFVVIENEWRDYRGPRKTFVCTKEIRGSDESQTVTLDVADFVSETEAAEPLQSWSHLDQLGICAHFSKARTPTAPRWDGPPPEFLRLEWKPACMASLLNVGQASSLSGTRKK